MSPRADHPLRQAVRSGAAGLLTLAVWTLWLVLALLLAAQIYIASTDTLEIPGFAQQALEARLAASGVHARLGRTHFDLAGQVVVEDVQLTLPGFDEPVITARAIAGRINLWALLANRFEPVEVRVTGLGLRVPAMLSLSGGADEIIRDGDAAFVPRGDELEIEHLTANLGGMPVAVQGTVRLGAVPWNRNGPAPLPLVEALARLYPEISRQCDAALAQLAAFDQPILQVRLEPGEGANGIAKIDFVAQGFKLGAPVAAQFSGVQASGDLAFGGTAPVPAEFTLAAAQAALPGGMEVRNAEAWIRGEVDASGDSRSPWFRPQSLDLVASEAAADTLRWNDAIVHLNLAAPPQVGAEIRGRLWDEPVSIGADLDWRAQTARVRFDGAAAPALIDFLGRRLRSDLGKVVSYTVPIKAAGEAQFGPGWAFQRASARIALTRLTARQVTLDEANGTVEFDGKTIRAPEAYARIGEDFARGSFTADVSTHDYRFLLDGRLRPLDITPWIAGGWWRDFFGNFSFPAEPIAASADLQGCFTDPRKFVAFLDVAVAQPTFRGVAVDRLHTRIFARPQFTDGLEFEVTRGAGAASGTFVRHFNLEASALESVDIAADSTLDLGPIGPMFGANGSFLEPFAFAQPPRVVMTGHFEGAGSPAGPHEVIHVEAKSDGPFRYYDFPFDRIAFVADVHDDAIVVDSLEAGEAGGTLTGKARVSGSGPDRRLSFDAALAHASLGQAISVVQGYSARRAGRTPTPPGKFVQEKANVRIDAAISAAGRFSDPLSFTGAGSAVLRGEEIGQIRMLGLLSELLPFTSLRFTTARAAFRIEGPKLVFSDVTVTGANSALAASGTYALDRSRLDFKVRVNPFQESKSLPRKFMDAVLTPISSALEVRLTGSVDKPKWAFVNGPTNFFRNLGPVQPLSPAPSLIPASRTPSAPAASVPQ